ncbi:hypothetical protein V9T40_011761 [Parthenolecanium corni]|uniref:RRM domain-containing protein n=1 Tax=Parthenolecanium corni TaxID=536013 RepID=A0AAN9XZU0_9HEMI
MKRKRGSKSKERDRNKMDDVKSHKHSRRKRKSSDSESDDNSTEVTVEQVEDSKNRPPSVKKTDELENNASNTRITRHSKRLAAISASSDELKEEGTEVISSPVKTGKLSPYSISSPSKECKKRDSGTPDKHRTKDLDVWKVKSANGAGSGELQKLKICRQRSPENIPLPEEPPSNDVEESLSVVAETSGPKKVAAEDPTEEANVEEDREIGVSYEVNLADIELPATEFVENSENIRKLTNEVVEMIVSDDAAAIASSQEEVQPLVSVDEGTSSSNTMKIEEQLVFEEGKQPSLISDAVPTESVTENIDEVQLSNETVDTVQQKNEATVTVEEIQVPNEKPIEVSVIATAEISEPEDITQAEIVLTVDENAIEEPNLVAAVSERDYENLEKRKSPVPLEEDCQPVIKSVDMDEIYDYENDDAKEEYNIKKRTISKEEFDASDSEDLIFVKEIREENIVHEIESETNNTSFYEKDDDDVIPSSPKRKTDSLEIKKMSLESDKIPDKSNKRITKDRALNHEGKSVLYITNLVRPFTVNQLRELLLRTGRIVEDGFWIDSIKSRCYVQFETEDEAFETRCALHGIRWPINNPKVLNVQFATQDDLLSAQAQTHESEIPRKTEPLVVSNHITDSTQKRIDWKKHFEQYDDRPKKIKDVREWDIGKPAHPDDMMFSEADDPKRKVEQEASKRSKKDKRRKNEISDDEVTGIKITILSNHLERIDDERFCLIGIQVIIECVLLAFTVKKPRKQVSDNLPIPEAKLLDDLFRRTKAAPSIYWLPLSEEQIASKQETRRKHLEDIDRQMKKHNNDHQDSRRRERERERRRSRR